MCPNCREDLTACRCDEADMVAERAAELHYDLVLRPARESAQVRSVREHQLRLAVDDMAPSWTRWQHDVADESERGK